MSSACGACWAVGGEWLTTQSTGALTLDQVLAGDASQRSDINAVAIRDGKTLSTSLPGTTMIATCRSVTNAEVTLQLAWPRRNPNRFRSRNSWSTAITAMPTSRWIEDGFAGPAPSPAQQGTLMAASKLDQVQSRDRLIVTGNRSRRNLQACTSRCCIASFYRRIVRLLSRRWFPQSAEGHNPVPTPAICTT